MNLYKLYQEENHGYDTYDSCIVLAQNEEVACSIRPDNREWREYPYSSSCWATKPENVVVELLGVADESLGTEACVILASFNAG